MPLGFDVHLEPCSRAVALVTGPIDTVRAPRGNDLPAPSSASVKNRTVELEVKVT